MKKYAVLLAVVAAMRIWTAGAAGATPSPNEWGKKYSDAQSDLSKAGFTAEVGPVVGDRLAQADCIVVNQRDEPSMSFGTKKYQTSEGKGVVLSLNCYGPASVKSPGFSGADRFAPPKP
ncbi:MAG: hypothetical protein QOH60_2975 [Mycobacterium sp.]|jgi:hypothetical protein|nr:hypothetical protein [Mycobacterium sp.]